MTFHDFRRFISEVKGEHLALVFNCLWGTWAVIGQSLSVNPMFRPLMSKLGWIHMDEELFFAGILFVGSVLMLFGMIQRRDRARIIGLFVSSCVWITLAIGVAMYSLKSTAVPMYLFCWIAYAFAAFQRAVASPRSK